MKHGKKYNNNVNLIEAGKFYEQDRKILLPLSITCHHAATDGYHVHRFLETLQQEADTFEQYL